MFSRQTGPPIRRPTNPSPIRRFAAPSFLPRDHFDSPTHRSADLPIHRQRFLGEFALGSLPWGVCLGQSAKSLTHRISDPVKGQHSFCVFQSPLNKGPQLLLLLKSLEQGPSAVAVVKQSGPSEAHFNNLQSQLGCHHSQGGRTN